MVIISNYFPAKKLLFIYQKSLFNFSSSIHTQMSNFRIKQMLTFLSSFIVNYINRLLYTQSNRYSSPLCYQSKTLRVKDQALM